MKKILVLLLLALHVTKADTIGGEVSFGLFSHAPNGYASYALPLNHTTSSADLKESFGFSESQDIFIKAYFEHPFPVIPNLKLSYITLTHTGTKNVDLFSWGNLIDLTGKIENSLSLDALDATLYYELLDNWIEADAGLTLRYLNGNMDVSTSVLSDGVNFSTVTPMIYGKVRLNVPTTDISLQFEANGITYAGFSAYDYELSARYTFMMGLGLEAGYKTLYIQSDELVKNLDADVDFSGLYAAAVWNF